MTADPTCCCAPKRKPGRRPPLCGLRRFLLGAWSVPFIRPLNENGNVAFARAKGWNRQRETNQRRREENDDALGKRNARHLPSSAKGSTTAIPAANRAPLTSAGLGFHNAPRPVLSR